MIKNKIKSCTVLGNIVLLIFLLINCNFYSAYIPTDFTSIVFFYYIFLQFETFLCDHSVFKSVKMCWLDHEPPFFPLIFTRHAGLMPWIVQPHKSGLDKPWAPN